MRNQNHLLYSLSFIVGLFVFIIVFIINWRINLIETALIRASIGFVVFSVFVFISYQLFVVSTGQKKIEVQGINVHKDGQLENSLGDTGQEEEQHFSPIQFEKIQDSQEVIKGVRKWLNSDD